MRQAHAAAGLRADAGRDQDLCRVGAQTGEKKQNNAQSQVDYSPILGTYERGTLCPRSNSIDFYITIFCDAKNKIS